MTAHRILLFLSAADCHACCWQNDEPSAATHFANDADGKKQFAAFLQAHCAPTILLTDLIEEDFRHETVPHLRGSERTALIRRKLEQYYRNTPFRLAVTLQHRKDGRHGDDMLFSALTNPALISPWLDIMLAHNIPLLGIYSVPCISAPLLKSLPSGSLLLLSWEKHAGLRQTYFDAGMLRFSRLTPLNDGASFGATAGTEAARTQQYLDNLSLLLSGSALNVYIICHADDRHELAAQLQDSPCIHYSYLDINELGRLAGSRANCADSDATPLFLHLLAANPARNHYAAAEHTRFLRLSHLHHALLGMSAAITASGLLWTAINIMHGMELEKQSRALRMQADQAAQQATQIIQHFPHAAASASDMKTSVILSRELGRYAPAPQEILGGLSKTLDDFHHIRINKLSWQASAAPPDGPENIPAQTILIDGELAESAGNYRSALEYLEHFRQALTQRGYGVTAQSLPLDVSPQGSISAEAVSGNNQPAQFSLKLSWRTAT